METTPSIGDLLNKNKDQVLQALICPEQKKQAARTIIGELVREVLHPRWRPIEVYEAGSFKRGTALFYDFDVDLVLAINSFDYREMETYFQYLRRDLINHFGNRVEFDRAPTFRYLKLAIQVASNEDLHIDLTITGDPARDDNGTPREFFQGWGSKEVDSQIQRLMQEYALLRPLVLLCKHWKKQRKDAPHTLKSYYIELVCYELLRSRPNSADIRGAFRAFLERMKDGPPVVRNLNPFSPQEMRPPKKHWDKIAEHALETLALHFASSAGWAQAAMLSATAAAETDDFIDVKRTCDVSIVNLSARCTVERSPRWEGECRYVARGEYTEGKRCGEACVAKWFKKGAVYEKTFYEEDLKAVGEAARVIDAFNLAGIASRKVFINHPNVWEYLEGEQKGQKALVEPMIEGFRKFNSNTGHAAADAEIMQALSHFSYQYSHGRYVLCDLQGGRFDDRYVLTDPIILSSNSEFGLGDLGPKGIANFFHFHRCNQLCSSSWRCARGQRHFEPREGSLLQTQPPPTGSFRPQPRLAGFQEIDEDYD